MAKAMLGDGPNLDYYDHSKKIGSGGFGSVYLYNLKDAHKHNRDLPMKMAVKNITETGNLEVREVELCSLAHKNIITFYGVERSRGTIYIKMEVAKSNLFDFQQNKIRGPIDFDNFMFFAIQITEGLVFLHDVGIVHRDIKPLNILALWPDNIHNVESNLSYVTLKLCDFGISRDDQGVTMTVTSIAGTPSYLAPEVEEALNTRTARRINYKRADVFSLGLVFHQLLLNRLPERTKEAGKPMELIFDGFIRKEFSEVLQMMLALKSSERIPARCALIIIQSWHNERLLEQKISKLERKLQQQMPEQKVDEQSNEQQKNNQHNASVEQNNQVTKQPEEIKKPLQQEDNLAHPVANKYSKLASSAEMEKDHGKGNRALHNAAQQGDIEEVKRLIYSGDDVNRVNFDGCTPLFFACVKDETLVAQLLIEGGADVNKADNLGLTPFILACYGQKFSAAKLLIERGANINRREMNSQTPLHLACSNDRLSIMQFLIDNNADINSVDDNGFTPLHSACIKGHLSVVQVLLKTGLTDINKACNAGCSALQHACLHGHLTVAELLLQNGADKKKLILKADGGPLLNEEHKNKREDFIKLLNKY